MSEEYTVVKVSGWQRFFVIVLYILISIGVLWGIAHIFTSASCNADSGCNKIDQVIYASASLFVIIFALLFGVLGIQGRLPGAKHLHVPLEKKSS